MQLIRMLALLGAVASAMPTFDKVIQTDAVARSGRRFVSKHTYLPPFLPLGLAIASCCAAPRNDS